MMADDKKYTVAEIDALRRVCENKFLWGRYSGPISGGMSRSYKETEKTKCVEEMVRIFMLNGTRADELYASEMPTKETT